MGTFQVSKPLASGEVGAMITKIIHNTGRIAGKPGYSHYYFSSNHRLTELLAVLILITQFKKSKKLEIIPLPEDKRVTQREYCGT